MKDFIGQDLVEGDYIAYPGGGNAKAEYGLLLLRIVQIRGDTIVAERLDVTYNPHTIISRKRSSIKANTKVVKVRPSNNVKDVFDSPEEHAELVAAWIHGRTEIDWENLVVGETRD